MKIVFAILLIALVALTACSQSADNNSIQQDDAGAVPTAQDAQVDQGFIVEDDEVIIGEMI